MMGKGDFAGRLKRDRRSIALTSYRTGASTRHDEHRTPPHDPVRPLRRGQTLYAFLADKRRRSGVVGVPERLSDRSWILGELGAEVAVLLGLFPTTGEAVAHAAALPSFLPARYRARVMITPSLKSSVAVTSTSTVTSSPSIPTTAQLKTRASIAADSASGRHRTSMRARPLRCRHPLPMAAGGGRPLTYRATAARIAVRISGASLSPTQLLFTVPSRPTSTSVG